MIKISEYLSDTDLEFLNEARKICPVGFIKNRKYINARFILSVKMFLDKVRANTNDFQSRLNEFYNKVENILNIINTNNLSKTARLVLDNFGKDELEIYLGFTRITRKSYYNKSLREFHKGNIYPPSEYLKVIAKTQTNLHYLAPFPQSEMDFFQSLDSKLKKRYAVYARYRVRVNQKYLSPTEYYKSVKKNKGRVKLTKRPKYMVDDLPNEREYQKKFKQLWTRPEFLAQKKEQYENAKIS